MPLARFDNLDDAQKTRILDAAQSEFARQGYEEASLAQIAAKAEISKGTLYYYFADRDDLYATVVMRMVEVVGSDSLLGAFAPTRAEDYWPALEKLFHAGFELARAHPEAIRALRGFQISIRRHPRPAFEPALALLSSHLRTIVESGRRLQCVRSDISVELLVQLLQSADEVLDGVWYESAAQSAPATERHAALALDTFRRLMVPPVEKPAQRAQRSTAHKKGGKS